MERTKWKRAQVDAQEVHEKLVRRIFGWRSIAAMLDHISLRVRDFDKALTFYKAALKPLGYTLLMEFPYAAGFGENGKPDFWIGPTDQPITPIHVAFVTDRKTVNAFHAAALAAGGKDNGAPGPREKYHPNYYGGFVLDPDGNNIEAVCHQPESAGKKASRKKPAKKAAGKAKAKSGGAAKKAAPKKKAAAKKPAAKKSAAKKPAAKKPAAKKAAPKKKTAPRGKAKRG